jgi:hypothetical protein
LTLPWAAANATVLDLRGPGGIDDFGDVLPDGAVLWDGEHEAQLSRHRKSVLSGGQWVFDDQDILIVRKPPEPLTDAHTGDEQSGYTVLVRDERDPTPVEVRFRLTALEHRGKGEAESVRYELEEVRA